LVFLATQAFLAHKLWIAVSQHVEIYRLLSGHQKAFKVTNDSYAYQVPQLIFQM